MNLTKLYIKTKELISEYYWVAATPLMIWGVILAIVEKEDIKQNQIETFGMVYNSKYIHKQYSKRGYKYEFFYKGKKYTGISTAYISENVKIGSFYKVEFSDKNPEHNQMVFDLEYVMQIKTNEKGEVDTTYIPKSQKSYNDMKKQIEQYKIELDSIKTKHDNVNR